MARQVPSFSLNRSYAVGSLINMGQGDISRVQSIGRGKNSKVIRLENGKKVPSLEFDYLINQGIWLVEKPTGRKANVTPRERYEFP
jgi:hypothetical protein